MDTGETIEAGDFIKARSTTCTGWVLRRYTHKQMDGWVVQIARGREDVIDDASAQLIAKSEAWWDRQAAEMIGTTELVGTQ